MSQYTGKNFHSQNLQKLVIEVRKVLNYQNPSFLWELFTGREFNDNLRIEDILILSKASTAYFGTNSTLLRGTIL